MRLLLPFGTTHVKRSVMEFVECLIRLLSCDTKLGAHSLILLHELD